ncbi:unnamed protein product [Rhizophagus irregularis]|nr:unnamed protein product [Rhizophagus irregularis]CAB5369281.1 unnamed protein product [Rhizophagus irregularis]
MSGQVQWKADFVLPPRDLPQTPSHPPQPPFLPSYSFDNYLYKQNIINKLNDHYINYSITYLDNFFVCTITLFTYL